MTDPQEPLKNDLLSGTKPRAPRGKVSPATGQALARVDESSQVALLAQVPAEEVWLASLESVHTRRAYQRDVRQFVAALQIGSRDELYAVTPAAIIKWRTQLEQPKGSSGKGLSKTTVLRKLSALSSLFQHLVEQGLSDINPVKQVKRPRYGRKDREGKTPSLVAEDVRRMLNAPPDDTVRGLRDRAILSVGFQNGLRRSEIAYLELGCVTVRQRLPHLEFLGKGGKTHIVPLNPQAHKRIQDYLALASHAGEELDSPLFRPTRANHVPGTDDMHRHLAPDMIDKIIRHWAAKVGVQGKVSAHTMRSTFVTRTLENGCPLERVQDDVGHADISTTQIYDHRSKNPEEAAPFFANY